MQHVVEEKIINSITLLEQAIVIDLNNQWFQEDIQRLVQVILDLCGNIVIQEKVIGADRESVRLTWLVDNHYTLNFDYYSQSCWFEAEDEQSRLNLPQLCASLEEKLCLNK